MSESKATPESPPELYRKHRPQRLRDVIGQADVVEQLTRKLKGGSWPHFAVFHGESGVGKTTLALIVARALLRSKEPADSLIDCHVIDIARSRGIDFSRELCEWSKRSPISGPVSVYILDEFHGMTKQALDALLELMENPPSHFYIVACTSEFDKLPRAVQTRAEIFGLCALDESAITGELRRVAALESIPITDSVVTGIAESAAGSMRAALTMLAAMAGLDPAQQAKALRASHPHAEVIELARYIYNGGTVEGAVAFIKKIPGTDWEGVRRCILAYFTTIAVSGRDIYRCAGTIECFADPYFHTGKSGLLVSIAKVYATRRK